jgi:hypothetical protein
VTNSSIQRSLDFFREIVAHKSGRRFGNETKNRRARQTNKSECSKSRSTLPRPKPEAVRQQTDDDNVGLGSFGMRAQVLKHFRRIAEPDVQYRLALSTAADDEGAG